MTIKLDVYQHRYELVEDDNTLILVVDGEDTFRVFGDQWLIEIDHVIWHIRVKKNALERLRIEIDDGWTQIAGVEITRGEETQTVSISDDDDHTFELTQSRTGPQHVLFAAAILMHRDHEWGLLPETK